MKKSDRELGMDRDINRRDFLNGASIAIAGAVLAPGDTGAQGRPTAPAPAAPPFTDPSPNQERYYPPALTGMRGSHEGSFEVAHEMRFGATWDEAQETGEEYDLIVVGGGLSGLAAAYFYKKALPESSVLILDNHDDFGGHAKRNEFTVGGRKLIGYGGTQFITGYYPPEATALLEDIGVSAERFPTGSTGDAYADYELARAIFFDRETFGVDRLVVGEPRGRNQRSTTEWSRFLARTPLSDRAKAGILQLYTEGRDYLPGLSAEEKIARLRRISYQDYMLQTVGVHEDVVPYFLRRGDPNGAAGIDSQSAWGAFRSGSFPGFRRPWPAAAATQCRSGPEPVPRHPLPRRQCRHCAADRPVADSRGPAGTDDGGLGDDAGPLRETRRARQLGADPPQQHGRRCSP